MKKGLKLDMINTMNHSFIARGGESSGESPDDLPNGPSVKDNKDNEGANNGTLNCKFKLILFFRLKSNTLNISLIYLFII